MAGKSGRLVVSWLFILIGVLILIIAINNSLKSRKSDKKQKEDRIESVSDGNKELAYTYTKTYTLKRGEVVRVFVPTWYKADCFGGGKKYYHQDQNGPKEIWGDGTFHQGSTNTKFFDLSYYDEEITVTVEFKRLR